MQEEYSNNGKNTCKWKESSNNLTMCTSCKTLDPDGWLHDLWSESATGISETWAHLGAFSTHESIRHGEVWVAVWTVICWHLLSVGVMFLTEKLKRVLTERGWNPTNTKMLVRFTLIHDTVQHQNEKYFEHFANYTKKTVFGTQNPIQFFKIRELYS